MSDINANVRHQCYREHRQVSRIDLPEGRRRRHGVGQISRADPPVRASVLKWCRRSRRLWSAAQCPTSMLMSDINAIESTGRSAGLTFQKVGGDDMVLGKFPGQTRL